MADFLETNLKKLAIIQKNHTRLLISIVIIFTVILGTGLKDLTMNSDVRKEMPTQLPVYQLGDRVSDKFGGKDTVVIMVKLDYSVDSKSSVRDIRDPRVIRSLIFLDRSLREENSVNSITSPASFFRGKDEISDEEIKETLQNNPQLSDFFSRDFKSTLMYVSADIGSGEIKIEEFTKLAYQKIEYTPKPPGISFSVTGQPVLRMTILELLKRDAVYTLVVSATLILLLLFAMQRSYTHGLLIFIPLSLGLIWTMGTLGWLGIPLSVATVALSSMILGLGVEYGVFVVSRYKEERAKNFNQLESLKTTVYGIGSAIIGSGITTMIGFGALSFSTVPMIQHLGQTLALGIGYSLLAALIANPLLILLEEDYDYLSTQRKIERLKIKREGQVMRGR